MLIHPLRFKWVADPTGPLNQVSDFKSPPLLMYDLTQPKVEKGGHVLAVCLPGHCQLSAMDKDTRIKDADLKGLVSVTH